MANRPAAGIRDQRLASKTRCGRIRQVRPTPSGRVTRRGSLTPGKDADLVVLVARPVFGCEPERAARDARRVDRWLAERIGVRRRLSRETERGPRRSCLSVPAAAARACRPRRRPSRRPGAVRPRRRDGAIRKGRRSGDRGRVAQDAGLSAGGPVAVRVNGVDTRVVLSGRRRGGRGRRRSAGHADSAQSRVGRRRVLSRIVCWIRSSWPRAGRAAGSASRC